MILVLFLYLQGMSDDVEVAKLTRERDEMRALLDKFERHMAEVSVWNINPLDIMNSSIWFDTISLGWFIINISD